MELVEREAALTALRAAVRPGNLILVAGEAGSGKTSLVRALAADLGTVLLGSCDSLRTPRPLAPILDWVPDPAQVQDALSTADLAVVEDANWADDATLDLLSHLLRRPSATRSAMLLTYRDDEVGRGHPLTLLLGDLASLQPTRVKVPPLTSAGVRSMAGSTRLDVEELIARTGGNAFFVSECLAAGTLDVSDGIRDAVLARLSRRSPEVREAVEVIACVPGRCELWLARRMGAIPDAVDEALDAGLLVADGAGRVSVRHELARQAVHDSIPAARRQRLHEQAVAALCEPPTGSVDHARVVHHAVLADRGPAVTEQATLAAYVALAAGARSQAVSQMELAIAYAPGDLDLLEHYAWLGREQALLGHDAVRSFDEAISRARAAGRIELAGILMAQSCQALWAAGRMPESGARVREAIELLEVSGASLHVGYGEACSHAMLMRELGAAAKWGARALEAACRTGDPEIEAQTAIQAGVAAWMDGQPHGLELLRSGIAAARVLDDPRLVSLGLQQLGSGGGEIRAYAEAVPALTEAISYAEVHELGSRMRYSQAWLGRCQAELGQWVEASETLAAVIRSPRVEIICKLTALAALGRLRARRGDPVSRLLLDEALALAEPTKQLQRIWPVAAARAEGAWLAGNLASELPLLLRVHEAAQDLDYRWAKDELAFWLRRAGVDAAMSGRTPYGLPADEAADAWAALGCPYEQADALAHSDDPERQLQGLALFESLGAVPAARLLITRRRTSGLRVPRGPNSATRGNPGGITDRELDVLRGVAAGLTNAQIAASLHMSAKTAGHHVGHLLDKLGARSRAEAVTKAVALGITL